jgi:hypothetical protein
MPRLAISGPFLPFYESSNTIVNTTFSVLFLFNFRLFCGDEGDRTLNLRLAKPALSQLSYVPEVDLPPLTREARNLTGCTWIRTMDLSLIRAAL